MKKLLSVLLALAILAGMTGCGNRQEIQFGADVSNFIGLTMKNVNDISDLCFAEYEQLQDDRIGTESLGEDYFNKCAARFEQEGGSLDQLAQRCQEIDQAYKKIMAMDVKAENADGLKDAVQRIYEAHQKLLARSTTIYGPAEDFLNECSGYFADASGAHSDAIDLLVPYHQKPGYNKLIN